MIRKIKNLVKKVIFTFIKPEIRYIANGIDYRNIPNSYSQAGEDVVIDFLLTQLNILTPTYLELGVFLGETHSNTFKFYNRGSKGVLVEADGTLIESIKNARPNDIVLNVGVGIDKQEEADFYIFDNQGLNTFSRVEAQSKQKSGLNKIKKIIKVPLLPINTIIENNFVQRPDFLSIDIEGLDLEVLKTLDFEKFPIPIICAETCMYSENHIKEKDHRIEIFLSSKGYFIYADTYINTIFVNKFWFENFSK